MPTLTLNLSGIVELQKLMQGLEQKALNMKPLLKGIGSVMVRSVQKNFDAGGRPEPWTPSKRALNTGGKTLIDTSRLMKSINAQVIDNNTVFIGTNVAYAAIHQFGGDLHHDARDRTLNFHINHITGRSLFSKLHRANFQQDVHVGEHDIHMPERPFLEIQTEDLEQIKELGINYFMIKNQITGI
ncbi:MAG: phage virion morphogenesis protein [Nitrospirae bacterium]|nr:phage virion morphogenesis protein [Nitrospirota bacterium]